MISSDSDQAPKGVRFDPWIGREYESVVGARWLLLGESHYGRPGTERPGFTKDVIRELVFTKRYSYFTKIAKLVLGLPPGHFLTDDDLHTFWNRVTFYNYVQSLVGTTARIRPTQTMWEAAKSPFLEVLRTVRPTHILVLGWELWRFLPVGSGERVVVLQDGTRYAFREYQLASGTAVAGCVKHPSGRGTRYVEDRRVVEALLDCTGEGGRPAGASM